ncbi:MAG: TonB C-terminal domain-containing protein, partial [Epsilonproteobacteria bacterium]|nr:TonB C-terminal domain-containing protein [Campylobacterota bacterium]
MQHQADDKYFFISGILALTIFFLFVASFFYVLFSPNITKTYGMQKEKFVSISLEDIPKPKEHKTQKKQIKKTEEKVVEKPKPQVTKKEKRKQVDAISQNVDVDSLFSNVWTKKVNKKTKKRDKDIKRIQEIDKKLDSIVKNIDKKLDGSKRIVKKTHTKETKAGSTGEEVNKYLAKIYAIVYDHFYPPANSQGNVIKAVIELSPFGKVIDFRILNYSASSALNQEADRIFTRLKNVIFPASPDNKTRRIIIKLIPEEKE